MSLNFYNATKKTAKYNIYDFSLNVVHVYMRRSARQHLNVMSKNTIRYVIAIFTRTPCKLRILARATIILE